jgi:hypothetical protein
MKSMLMKRARPGSRKPGRYARREAGDGLRPADPDRAAEHALHVIGDILELGAAAGQHDLAPDRAGEAELLERRLDLVGQLLDPLADDHHQLGAGDAHRLGALLGADLASPRSSRDCRAGWSSPSRRSI